MISLILSVNDSLTFTILDTIGLFPQMKIVSLCSVVLVLHLILEQVDEQSVFASVPFASPF